VWLVDSAVAVLVVSPIARLKRLAKRSLEAAFFAMENIIGLVLVVANKVVSNET
jgi:hypothetical protein